MKRDFKGIWIPKEIWLNEELTIMEKVFFIEIDSLDNEDGCYASNNYFADFFKITPQRASQVINSLIKKKYLTVKYEYNGLEIKKRVLNIFDRGIKFSKLGIKFSLKGYQEKFKDNNISNKNNINKYIDKNIEELLILWNNCNLIKHKFSTLKLKFKKKHFDIIKDITIEKTRDAVRNYALVLEGDQYYFNYKWSLWEFLERGIFKFLPEADPFTNYLKDKQQPTLTAQQEIDKLYRNKQ